MSNSFYPLLGLLRIVIVAGLSGLTFATLLFKEKINAGLLLLGATLGLAVYSLIFTVAGLLGFLQNPDVLFIFVCGLLIFLVPLQLLLKRNRLIWPKATFTDWKAPNIPTLIILWLVIIFQILMLVNATAPHINQDTETYHYVFLRQFIESGTISIDPENAYSYYPMSIQMMVAAAFNLAGDRGPEAANLCYWFMQVLLLLWLVDFNARRGRPDIGWFTAAAVCGIFYWPVIAYSGYIDGGVALFAVAGVLSYFDWLENRTENKTLQLICTAIFLGIAISGKYSALAVAAMVIVHFLWVTLTSRESGHIKWKTILIALLFFIIPIIPWYGRNLLLTGNPTFPFLHGIFGGPELTLADDIGTWANWGIPVTLKNLLIYPLKLSFFFKLGDSFLRVPYMYMSWLFFLSPLAGLL
ncbi:MAG TPA: phospholipid carrier-dependent glycosyltransferase, partial [bacterium]